MSYSEHPCINPECDVVTVVKHYPATRTDPGYPDRDDCEGCGADLDWSAESEPAEPPDDMFEQADAAYEREGDR